MGILFLFCLISVFSLQCKAFRALVKGACYDFFLGLVEGGISRHGSGRLLVLQDMIPAKLSGGNETIHIGKMTWPPRHVMCTVDVEGAVLASH